eukprot:scaffold7500_cov127-Isochrysis_galbana.AAC.29
MQGLWWVYAGKLCGLQRVAARGSVVCPEVQAGWPPALVYEMYEAAPCWPPGAALHARCQRQPDSRMGLCRWFAVLGHQGIARSAGLAHPKRGVVSFPRLAWRACLGGSVVVGGVRGEDGATRISAMRKLKIVYKHDDDSDSGWRCRGGRERREPQRQR